MLACINSNFSKRANGNLVDVHFPRQDATIVGDRTMRLELALAASPIEQRPLTRKRTGPPPRLLPGKGLSRRQTGLPHRTTARAAGSAGGERPAAEVELSMRIVAGSLKSRRIFCSRSTTRCACCKCCGTRVRSNSRMRLRNCRSALRRRRGPRHGLHRRRASIRPGRRHDAGLLAARLGAVLHHHRRGRT